MPDENAALPRQISASRARERECRPVARAERVSSSWQPSIVYHDVTPTRGGCETTPLYTARMITVTIINLRRSARQSITLSYATSSTLPACHDPRAQNGNARKCGREGGTEGRRRTMYLYANEFLGSRISCGRVSVTPRMCECTLHACRETPRSVCITNLPALLFAILLHVDVSHTCYSFNTGGRRRRLVNRETPLNCSWRGSDMPRT